MEQFSIERLVTRPRLQLFICLLYTLVVLETITFLHDQLDTRAYSVTVMS